MVYGENNKIYAEIYPDFSAIPTNMPINEYFKKMIADFNKELPYYKKIQEFKIRDSEFDKTTTKKIKRGYTNVR